MQARHRYMTGVPAIMEAAHLLRSLGMAAWLLLTQPGRWLRLRVALRRLGAIVAEHAAEPSRPLPLERLLARRAEAERRLAATAPPWPSAEIDLVERARGFLRGGLLRYAGPRQLARWRLRAVERQLGAAAMDLAELPGPVLAVRQHAGVAEEALAGARADIADQLAEAADSSRALAAATADGVRTASVITAHALLVASMAAGRATRTGSLATGRATRTASLATGRATRTASRATGRAAWAGLVAVGRGVHAVVLALGGALLAIARGVLRAGRAAGRPLCPIVRALAAPPDPRLPAWRRFLRPVAGALTLTLLAGALAGLPAAAMLGGSVKAASAGLPDLANLQPLSQPERTQVYDRDGHLIEVLHDEQDRIVVPLTSMPQVLRDAVLAAEDERFYQHHGIDDRGILRALLANLIQGQTVQGGSTITQQLVRNAYPDLRDRSLVRKVKEASLAAQLEERMTKDQILEAYLNRVYFGAGYYGVEAASRGYFGRHVADLSLAQAATLAGLIREPEGANPRNSPDRAVQRRNTVLQQMVSLDMVSPTSAAKATRTALKIQPPRETGGRYPWFIDALKRQLMDDPRLGGTVAERRRNLYEGGLRIITTLDTTVQQQAERAAATWRPASGPDVALVSLDPRNGAVRAMVGGRNYSRHKFNLAIQAERQAGSSFKPFVLAAAMDDGISPDSLWESSGFSSDDVCGVPWKVENFEGHGSGKIPLREATWHSVNGVYARVMARLCPSKVVSMAKRAGVDVPEAQSHAPSIALGSANVTPIQMASAYATFANLGVYQKPILFTQISRHGQTLIDNHPQGERRISAALAYQVTDVLKGVVRSGTGTAAQIGRPEAGKTGTTQDFRDAWFIGYTPQLSTAVWMGDPQQEVPMQDVGGIRVTGGSYPARIWHDFMAAALADQAPLDWSQPAGSLGFSVAPPSTGTPGDYRRPRRHGRGRG
jgi:penicillin-binding protein 1A